MCKSLLLENIPTSDFDRFIVGVDNVIAQKAEKEIFTYCVIGVKGDEFTIYKCITVINDYTGKLNSSFQEYCNQLGNYFNCRVYCETNQTY
jgi:hypothetical protein